MAKDKQAIAFVQSTRPAEAPENSLWLNTSCAVLYVRENGAWVCLGSVMGSDPMPQRFAVAPAPSRT